MRDHYLWKHVIGFEETSLVGTVYFANYVLWQGHCREGFLHDEAPGVAQALKQGELMLITLSCNCDYTRGEGFTALDEVLIEMRLESFRGGRMALDFRYFDAREPTQLVARGGQQVACKARRGDAIVPVPFPPEVVRALLAYTTDPRLLANLEDALAFQGVERPSPSFD